MRRVRVARRGRLASVSLLSSVRSVERQIAELTEFKRELDKLHERASDQQVREAGSDCYCHIIEDGR